jgi:hypothetical protein
MTAALFANLPIDTAMVRAEMTVCERRAGSYRPFTRDLAASLHVP